MVYRDVNKCALQVIGVAENVPIIKMHNVGINKWVCKNNYRTSRTRVTLCYSRLGIRLRTT